MIVVVLERRKIRQAIGRTRSIVLIAALPDHIKIQREPAYHAIKTVRLALDQIITIVRYAQMIKKIISQVI